jgi:hypothetical protein
LGGRCCCKLENGIKGLGKAPASLMASLTQVGVDEGVEAPRRTRRRRGCSGEDLTMTWRLWGGLDDGTGSREVHNGAGSREIFGGNFWLLDGVSESLRGLGFANATQ